MNTRRGKSKFKTLLVILDSWYSSKILMGRLIEKYVLKNILQCRWNTQAGNITNNLKVKVDFTLTALSAMNVVTWKCHVGDSAKGR